MKTDYLQKAPGKQTVLFVVLGLFLLMGEGIWTLQTYVQTRKTIHDALTPEGQKKTAKKEVEETVATLQHLALVPDEEPYVATITNVEQLLSQSDFYHDAQNGDKLVLFPNAQKAYIYSPARNILVNVGPLSVETPQPTIATVSATYKAMVRIEIRNGSGVKGAAVRLQETLQQKGYLVEKIGDANADNYTQTLIVDQTEGEEQAVVRSLHDDLVGQIVQSIPEGEDESSRDILIILASP